MRTVDTRAPCGKGRNGVIFANLVAAAIFSLFQLALVWNLMFGVLHQDFDPSSNFRGIYREIQHSTAFKAAPRLLFYNVPEEKKLRAKPSRNNDFVVSASSTSKAEKHDQRGMEHYLPNQWTPEYQNNCVDMTNWQSQSFPTCNIIHESIMTFQGPASEHTTKPAIPLIYIGAGGWRATFGHTEYEEMVVKLFTLGDEYDFDPRSYEIHRVDALVSERLTSSPHIMNIYGYCGLTTLYERGDQTLTRVIQKGGKEHPLSYSQKVKYAYQVAHALADMHGIESGHRTRNETAVVHRDLKSDNIILSSKGILKLNDFNDSVLRKWNQTAPSGGAPCPYYNKGFPLHWGNGYKPVEMASREYPPLDEKLDIFGLGALLYFILVGRTPYSHLSDKQERVKAMEAGELPDFPDEYDASASGFVPEIQTMVYLIKECMALQPSQRPSAKYVMQQLEPFVNTPMSE